MDKEFHELIKEICKNNNIKYKLISNNWITILKKNNITKVIVGYKFDNNSYALGKIFDDKYATYELLKENNIDVLEHSLVYPLTNKNEYAKGYNNIKYIEEIFNKYNKNIVIKINNGTCGRKVNKFDNIKELKKYYKKIKGNKSYSITPFCNIENEYRTIILNNEIKLIYKKELPYIYGDGKTKIEDLLKKFNYEYFKNTKNNKVLKNNEKYLYGWKFNLSNGARPSLDINEKDKKEILKIINKLIKKFDLGFCSVDIIKTNNKFMVLEINSGVMMINLMKEINKEIAYKIYEEAILNMLGGK